MEGLKKGKYKNYNNSEQLKVIESLTIEDNVKDDLEIFKVIDIGPNFVLEEFVNSVEINSLKLDTGKDSDLEFVTKWLKGKESSKNLYFKKYRFYLKKSGIDISKYDLYNIFDKYFYNNVYEKKLVLERKVLSTYFFKMENNFEDFLKVIDSLIAKKHIGVSFIMHNLPMYDIQKFIFLLNKNIGSIDDFIIDNSFDKNGFHKFLIDRYKISSSTSYGFTMVISQIFK